MNRCILTVVGILVAAPAASAETVELAHTGAAQTFTVPAGVTELTVTLDGASGGDGCAGYESGLPVQGALGGKGARVTATLAVTPGQSLQVNVGGRGGGFHSVAGQVCTATGGFNGGGAFPIEGSGAGGGGGATDVRIDGARVLVAGGGGGAGAFGIWNGAGSDPVGGAGGDSDANGSSGVDSDVGVFGGDPGRSGSEGGFGGSGAGALADPGTPDGLGGRGGFTLTPAPVSPRGPGMGGGGGGGWVGGGGGGAGGYSDGMGGTLRRDPQRGLAVAEAGGGGGGGGGSSHAGAGTSAVTILQGQRTGDGRATIVYTAPPSTGGGGGGGGGGGAGGGGTATPQSGGGPAKPFAPAAATPAVTTVVDNPADVLLCNGKTVTLINLERSGRSVTLEGIAVLALAGRTIQLTADHGARPATAKVKADGSFSASVPVPRSDQTSYTARFGKDRSSPLKVTRHLWVVSQATTGKGLRITARHSKGGRVAGETATLRRQTSCDHSTSFATAKFDRRGEVSFLLPLPTPPSTVAVYRVTTKVNNTYTLPIVVRR